MNDTNLGYPEFYGDHAEYPLSPEEREEYERWMDETDTANGRKYPTPADFGLPADTEIPF